MENFADRLIAAIEKKRSAAIVGLDPRVESMPSFIAAEARRKPSREESIRFAISSFHRLVIDSVHDLIPAIKPQSAFYEQYGIPGMQALIDTIEYAREKGVLVIMDAKRNDIGSTAEAYANAFLGQTTVFGSPCPAFQADALTVSPYLGGDSLAPFVQACQQFGTGIFVLVKTSNRGSRDLQDLPVGAERTPLCLVTAKLVGALGKAIVGQRGYSSVGAVVGATFPDEAERLRALMPNTIFLVPGFGAQGGSAADAAKCFCPEGLGAIVNSSRGITYKLPDLEISKEDYCKLVRARVAKMVAEINSAVMP